MLGAAALLLAWGFLGKKKPPEQRTQSKPREGTARKPAKPGSDGSPKQPARPSVGGGEQKPDADTQKQLATTQKQPGARAIVWEVPQANQDDDDITVLRAIPVFDNPADISIESLPIAAPSTDDEPDEERVSRVELSYEEGADAEEVTAASARILLYAGGDSDQGRVRARNEDSMLMMPERSLFAIADGMGGHRGGEVASSIAIDTLRDAFDRSAFEARVDAEGNVPRRARELAAAVQQTNECVRSMALADRELAGMGTTLVAGRFSPNKQRLYVGHVGDSRCYRLRQGKLRQLTTDHTMASLGMQGPHAKDLYQAVGVNQGLTIDLIVDKPQEEDIYLFCSDGLSKMMQDDEIRDVLVQHEDLESALYTLIEESNDRGGKDNISVIIVKVLSRTSKKALETLTREVVSN